MEGKLLPTWQTLNWTSKRGDAQNQVSYPDKKWLYSGCQNSWFTSSGGLLGKLWQHCWYTCARRLLWLWCGCAMSSLCYFMLWLCYGRDMIVVWLCYGCGVVAISCVWTVVWLLRFYFGCAMTLLWLCYGCAMAWRICGWNLRWLSDLPRLWLCNTLALYVRLLLEGQ